MPLSHETIRSALAAQPLFEDKTWQLSPEAWPLDAAQVAWRRRDPAFFALGQFCI